MSAKFLLTFGNAGDTIKKNKDHKRGAFLSTIYMSWIIPDHSAERLSKERRAGKSRLVSNMSVEKQAGVNKFPRNVHLFLQIYPAVHLNGMIPLLGRQPERKGIYLYVSLTILLYTTN